MSSTPAWVWTKRALASSTSLVFGIFGLKLQSKSASVCHGDDAGLFQPPRIESIGPTGELVLDEQLEEFQVGERGRLRLGDAAGQGFDHAGEAEMTEPGRELRIHRRKVLQGVLGHRTNRRVVGAAGGAAGAGGARLDELADGLVAKDADGRGPAATACEDPLARMPPRQARARLESGEWRARRGRRGAASAHCWSAGPTRVHWPSKPVDEGLLPRGGLGLAGARREEPGRDFRVDGHERVRAEDAHQLRVPLHADASARAATSGTG